MAGDPRIEKLHRRFRQHQSRLAVRAWEYRQRRHAHGVWGRLRRVLADAEHAYIVAESDAALLIAEGSLPVGVGAELEPARLLLFASRERVAAIPGAREIPVRLSSALLTAPAIVLVAFSPEDEPGGT